MDKNNPFRFPNIGVEKFLELNSEQKHDDYCLAYVFTDRDFDDGVLGLAWVGAPSGWYTTQHNSTHTYCTPEYNAHLGGAAVRLEHNITTTHTQTMHLAFKTTYKYKGLIMVPRSRNTRSRGPFDAVVNLFWFSPCGCVNSMDNIHQHQHFWEAHVRPFRWTQGGSART